MTSAAQVEADADEFRVKRDALVQEASQALSAFAHELHKQKLYRDRNEVAERLLTYFPDDKTLRSWLDYKRDRKTKEWHRKKNAKQKKNYNKELADQVPSLFEERVTPKLDRIWELLRDAEADIPRGDYQRTLGELIHLGPDDERFRKANGEVHQKRAKGPGDWILLETQTALKRRKELGDAAVAAISDAPEPTDTEITKRDLELGVTWGLGVQTPRVRVLTSAGYSHCVDVARACHASVQLFEKAFDRQASGRRTFAVCLLQFEGQKNKIIAKLRVPAAEKAFLRTLSGFPVAPDYLIQAEGKSPASQKDSAVRSHFHAMQRGAFGGGFSQPPGMSQGLGLYLTYKLIGTRLTVFVEQRESRYQLDDLPDTPSLEDSDADWVYVGHKWDEAGRLPLLTSTFALKLNDLHTEDLLFAYCFARYIVEGRPEDAAAFFKAVGHKTTSDLGGVEEACIEKLGLTILDLDKRVRRWMKEMAQLSSD